MPIYEYKCKNCGRKFEKLVFGKEEIKCPKCGSKFLHKLFSTFSSSGKSDSNRPNTCSEGTCNLGCPTCGD